MARAKQATTEEAPGPVLIFTGARDAQGRPVEFYSGVPARDLMVRDYQRLTAEQQRMIWDSHLYGAGPDAESAPRPADEPDVPPDGARPDEATGEGTGDGIDDSSG
jgi:hypothetical protein